MRGFTVSLILYLNAILFINIKLNQSICYIKYKFQVSQAPFPRLNPLIQIFHHRFIISHLLYSSQLPFYFLSFILPSNYLSASSLMSFKILSIFYFKYQSYFQILEYIRNRSTTMGMITNFILYFDSFTAPATLRTSDGGQTNSMCTGIFSFLLTGFFMWVFVSKSMEITKFEEVEANSLLEDELDRLKQTQVMFAMNVFEEHGNLVNNPYFQFYALVLDNEENIIEQEKLELCQLSQWKGIDEKILTEFYDIESWFCPSKPLPMQGFRTGKNTTFINLKIDYCLTQTHCTTIPDIQNHIFNQKKMYGYMTAEFLMMDVGFTFGNENSTVPVVKYFKGTFTETAGIVLDIWMAQYEIQTDVNFAPWEVKSKDNGSYILSEQHFASEYDKDWNYLVECNIRFESKTMKAERAYGKIDDVFSYFGGLLGIIVSIFAFFLGGYNQYRYELKMAEGCFKYDDGSQFKADNMNFCVYIGYTIFDWIRSIFFCCTPKWRYMNKLDETREEANQQLNVFYLYKKLQYLEDLSMLNLSKEEAICMSITAAPTLQEVKIKRSFLQYYDDIVQGEKAIELQKVYPKNQDCSSLQKEERVRNLGIKELKEVVEEYRQNNPEEFKKVEQLELEQQQEEAQKELAKAFLGLPQERRGKIQGKYPMVILHQLLKQRQERELKQIENLHEKSGTNLIAGLGRKNSLEPAKIYPEKSNDF